MGKTKKAGVLKSFLSILVLGCVLSFGSFSANETKPTSSSCPSVMPKGTVCLTTAELAELRDAQEIAQQEGNDLKLKLAEVTFEWKKAKLKGRKFGGVVGCGGVIYFQVEEGDLDWDLAPACGALWGYRW